VVTKLMDKLALLNIDPIEVLLSSAIRDQHKRFHFYKALLELELVVLGSPLTAETDTEEETETFLLKYLEMDQGLVLPVYSSVEKFTTIFKDEYDYVKISTRDLLQVVEPGTSWVLNAGHDISKIIISEELETLRDGRIIHYFFEQLSMEEQKSLLENQGVKLPSWRIKEIKALFQRYPQIKKAYLANIYNPLSGERPSPFIGMELEHLEQEEAKEIVHDLYDTVNRRKIEGMNIELVVLDEHLPLTSSLTQRVEPFYSRQTPENLRELFK